MKNLFDFVRQLVRAECPVFIQPRAIPAQIGTFGIFRIKRVIFNPVQLKPEEQ